MDADIAAAASALELDKIKAQDYRDSLRKAAEDRAAFRALAQGMFDWFKSEYATLPTAANETRTAMGLAIAAKYFTTGTATTPESVLLDAQNDARRFKAALDEAMKAL